MAAAAGRVAVMLIGLLRSFRSPVAVQHMYDYTERALELQGEAVDSFLCTASSTGDAKQAAKLSMIRSIWPLAGVWEDGDLDCSGEGKECPQFERLLVCFRHVMATEQVSGVQYNWFVRLRPDAVVRQPLPRIITRSTEDPRTVYGQGMYFLSSHLTSPASQLHVPVDYKWRPAKSKHSVDCKTIWDGFAVVPRSISSAYFSNSWRGMRDDRVRRPQGWISASRDVAMHKGGCLGMVAPQRDPAFKKWTPEGVLSRQVFEANGTLEPDFFPQIVGIWWSHVAPNSAVFAEQEASTDACLQRTHPLAVDIIAHRNATPQGCSPLRWDKGKDYGGAGTSFDFHACTCRKGWAAISAATAADIAAEYHRRAVPEHASGLALLNQPGIEYGGESGGAAASATSTLHPAHTVLDVTLESNQFSGAAHSAKGSKAKCIQGKQFNLRTRKLDNASAWVASFACLGHGRSVHVCSDRKNLKSLNASAKDCGQAYHFYSLPSSICASFHTNHSLARQLVHRNAQDHHNGKVICAISSAHRS